MMRQVMEAAGLTLWPMLSLLIFTLSCGVVLLWMFRPGAAEFYGNLSRMALDGEGKEKDAHGG